MVSAQFRAPANDASASSQLSPNEVSTGLPVEVPRSQKKKELDRKTSTFQDMFAKKQHGLILLPTKKPDVKHYWSTIISTCCSFNVTFTSQTNFLRFQKFHHFLSFFFASFVFLPREKTVHGHGTVVASLLRGNFRCGCREAAA